MGTQARALTSAFDFEDPEEIRGIVRAVATAPGSAVGTYVSDRALAQLKRREQATRRQNFKVYQHLTTRQQDVLEKAYPGYDFQYISASNGGHGLAAVRRALEQQEMLSRYARSTTVCDVGGNYAVYVMQGRKGVHCDSPLLDARDVARANKRDVAVTQWARKADTRSKFDEARAFLANKDKYICRKTSQECCEPAEVCMFLHSVYDIEFEDMALIVHNKKSVEAVGTMTFSPEVLVQDSGVVAGVEQYFVKEDRYVLRGKDGRVLSIMARDERPGVLRRGAFARLEKCIAFCFPDDVDHEYVHVYDNYLKYVTRTFCHSKKSGTTLYIEKSLENGVLKFSATPVTGVSGEQRASVRLWYPMPEATKMVWCYRMVRSDAVRFENAFERYGVPVSARLIDESIGYALSKDVQGVNRHELFGFVRGFNVRFTVNGTDMTTSRREEQTVLFDVTTTLFVEAFRQKYAQAVIAGKCVGQELEDRGLRDKGFFGLLLPLLYYAAERGFDWVEKSIGLAWDFFKPSRWLQWFGGELSAMTSDKMRSYVKKNCHRSRHFQMPGLAPAEAFTDMADVHRFVFEEYRESLPTVEEYEASQGPEVQRAEDESYESTVDVLETMKAYALDSSQREALANAIEYVRDSAKARGVGTESTGSKAWAERAARNGDEACEAAADTQDVSGESTRCDSSSTSECADGENEGVELEPEPQVGPEAAAQAGESHGSEHGNESEREAFEAEDLGVDPEYAGEADGGAVEPECQPEPASSGGDSREPGSRAERPGEVASEQAGCGSAGDLGQGGSSRCGSSPAGAGGGVGSGAGCTGSPGETDGSGGSGRGAPEAGPAGAPVDEAEGHAREAARERRKAEKRPEGVEGNVPSGTGRVSESRDGFGPSPRLRDSCDVPDEDVPAPRRNKCLLAAYAYVTGQTMGGLWQRYSREVLGPKSARQVSEGAKQWSSEDLRVFAKLDRRTVRLVKFTSPGSDGRVQFVGEEVFRYGPEQYTCSVAHVPGHFFAPGCGDEAVVLPSEYDTSEFREKSVGVGRSWRRGPAGRWFRKTTDRSGGAVQAAVPGAGESVPQLYYKRHVFSEPEKKSEARARTELGCAAVEGYVRYLRADHERMVNAHKAAWGIVSNGGRLGDTMKKLFNLHDFQYQFFRRTGSGAYAITKGMVAPTHVYCPDKEAILPVLVNNAGTLLDVDSSAPSVLGSTELNYYFVGAKMQALEGRLPTTYDSRRVFADYMGVGGCGKTRTICEDAMPNDVVLCPLSSTVEATRTKLEGSVHPARVRSVDSYLLNCVGKVFARVLWIDEGKMMDPGEVMLLAELTGAAVVWVVGDTDQFDKQYRVPGFVPARVETPYTRQIRNMVSNRSPMDAVVVNRCSPNYGPEYKTTSKVVRSLHMRTITSPGGVPDYYEKERRFKVSRGKEVVLPDVLWLTFTKADRDEMRKRGYRWCKTIGESQGAEASEVHLIRLSAKSSGFPYNDFRQRNVAMTRHTQVFTYHVVDGAKDLVVEAVNKAQAIRDIVREHGPMPEQRAPKPRTVVHGGKMPKGAKPSPVRLSGALNVFQRVYEVYYPGAQAVPMRYENYNIEYSDKRMIVPMCGSFKGPTAGAPKKSFKGLRPRLRTVMPPPRAQSLFQAVAALNKRNLRASPVALLEPMDHEVTDAVVAAMDVMCVKDWKQRLAEYESTCGDVPAPDILAAYLNDAPQHAVDKAVKLGFDGYQMEIDNFEYIIKRSIKSAAVLSDSWADAYPAPQTVMFNKKNVNVFYGAIYREFVERFKALLKPNVLLHVRKNLDQVESHLNSCGVVLENCVTVQNDFSKYDKSQGRLTQLIEAKLFELLGCYGRCMKDWFAKHVVTRNVGYAVGVKVWLLYQRKSGDASTSAGNTVVGMVAVVFAYKVKRFEYAMFLGDDSCLFIRRSDVDLEALSVGPKNLAEYFGFEAKCDLYDYGYFCGYFLLTGASGTVVMVRDPMRALVKFGRWDVPDKDALKEHWVSFRDTLRGYDDELVLVQAAAAAAHMYKYREPSFVLAAMRALVTVRDSFAEFSAFWEDEVEVFDV